MDSLQYDTRVKVTALCASPLSPCASEPALPGVVGGVAVERRVGEAGWAVVHVT